MAVDGQLPAQWNIHTQTHTHTHRPKHTNPPYCFEGGGPKKNMVSQRMKVTNIKLSRPTNTALDIFAIQIMWNEKKNTKNLTK